MNEHFVTCTVMSLHKLALFVIVLVTAGVVRRIQNLLIIVFKRTRSADAHVHFMAFLSWFS